MVKVLCPCGGGAKFNPGRGGRVKKWATTTCKHRIESACRRWAMTLFEHGLIGSETLAPYLPGAEPASGPRVCVKDAWHQLHPWLHRFDKSISTFTGAVVLPVRRIWSSLSTW